MPEIKCNLLPSVVRGWQNDCVRRDVNPWANVMRWETEISPTSSCCRLLRNSPSMIHTYSTRGRDEQQQRRPREEIIYRHNWDRKNRTTFSVIHRCGAVAVSGKGNTISCWATSKHPPRKTWSSKRLSVRWLLLLLSPGNSRLAHREMIYDSWRHQ